MVVAVVSDHGFERAETVVNLPALLKQEGISGDVRVIFGVAATSSDMVIKWMRQAAREGRHGVGREIPQEELKAFAPQLAEGSTAFEPAEHYLFSTAAAAGINSKPSEIGVHGLWPGRNDYAASLILWGKGIKHARKPRASMLTFAPRFAEILGLNFQVNGSEK